jgi:hypothetical protein
MYSNKMVLLYQIHYLIDIQHSKFIVKICSKCINEVGFLLQLSGLLKGTTKPQLVMK